MNKNLHPPGPKSLPLVGILPQLYKNPLQTFQDLHTNFGGFVRFQKGSNHRYICYDPDSIHQILVTNSKNYKKSQRYEKLKQFLGRSLVTANGNEWQFLRKMAQPGFVNSKINDYFPCFKSQTHSLIQRLSKKDQFNLSQEMMMTTLGIIGESIIHYDLSKHSDILGPAFEFCIQFMNQRMESFIDWSSWFETSELKNFKNHKKTIDQLMFQLINDRKNNSPTQKDFLDVLINEQRTNSELSDDLIKDQLITFIVAGHETSANMITWTLLLLLKNPIYLKKIKSEIQSLALNDYSELNQMKLIELCLKESLRLFPPVWMISRDSLGADTIMGFSIGEDETINICPYVTHRSPKYWASPNDFNPYRFESEYNKKAYIPFSAGPRVCLGAQFAIQEGKWIIANLIKNFEISCENVDLTPSVNVVLRPKTSHLIKLTECKNQ